MAKKYFASTLLLFLAACSGGNVDTALLKDPKVGDQYVIDYGKLKVERKMANANGGDAGFLPSRIAKVSGSSISLETGKEEFGELSAANAELGSGKLDDQGYFSPYTLEIPKADLVGYADKQIILNTVRP
jgi:hypothetical protein